MNGSDLVAFRDAVARDVAVQYLCVDYVEQVVANAIERHAKHLGWTWFDDGPRPSSEQQTGGREMKATAGQAAGGLLAALATAGLVVGIAIALAGCDTQNPFGRDEQPAAGESTQAEDDAAITSYSTQTVNQSSADTTVVISPNVTGNNNVVVIGIGGDASGVNRREDIPAVEAVDVPAEPETL